MMTRRIWLSFAVLFGGTFVLAAAGAREHWPSALVLVAFGAVVLGSLVAAGDDMDRFLNRLVRNRSQPRQHAQRRGS
jgi:uncharacterized integral membrane protein